MNSGKTNFSNNLGEGEYQQQMQDGEREMMQSRDTGSTRNYGARPKVSLLIKHLTMYWILKSVVLIVLIDTYKKLNYPRAGK